MRVYHGLNDLTGLRTPIVTVGSYDGVHAGHRFLLNMLKTVAESAGGQSTVITFASHPRLVLSKESDLHLLSTLDEKVFLLSELGIDNLIVLPFDLQFSLMSPEHFVEHILIGKIGAKGMVVGYNHHFGHDKRGNFEYLEKIHLQFGFKVYEAPKFAADGQKVSSTVIRNVVQRGDMALAADLLGHPYIIMAHYDASGQLSTGSELKLLPADGEYNVKINGYKRMLKISAGAISLIDNDNIISNRDIVITFC